MRILASILARAPIAFRPKTNANPSLAGVRLSGRSRPNGLALFLEGNHTKESYEIVVGTGGEEQLVGRPIRPSSVTKFNSPELIDVNYFIVGVLQCTDELTGDGVECIDGPAVCVI